jgi:hypothetical protein
MKTISLNIPDKIFGVDSANIISFAPLVVLLCLVMLSVNLVYVPKVNDLLVMKSNLAELQGQTQSVLEKTRYLQSIDPVELQKNANSLSSALMPQKNAYLLVDVVRKVIEKYSFQVDSFLINPGKIDDKTAKVSTGARGVSKIPIKIVITGPKSGYLDLVKAVERTLPILAITSFKMNSVGSLSKLEMEITAFYLEDNTQFDINKLTLNDLTLKKEETDLVTNLGTYQIVEKGEDDASKAQVGFKKYERKDPFSP